MDDSTESELVAVAVRALGAGRGRVFDDATVALAQRCDGQQGARVVVGTVVDSLRAATTGAWERGWQPADVHRMAVRALGVDEQAVVLDVVVDEARPLRAGDRRPVVGLAGSRRSRRWCGGPAR